METLEIPRFTIDLDQSPLHRYDHVVPYFEDTIAQTSLPDLWHEILRELVGSRVSTFIQKISPWALRRVYRDEETFEIKGIARATNIPMHILVAFNVMLDVLLGCTSGGALVSDGPNKTKMLHFRTLDWGMDTIRQLLVELDFVRGRGPVLGTIVTYLGYVGCLTGVRKGLSVSLNFRSQHKSETWKQRVLFRWHQAMVVLGYQQAIPSVLRGFILGQHRQDATDGASVEAAKILEKLESANSTAAYLVLCEPTRVFMVEKDNRSALIHQSEVFQSVCNHDISDEADPSYLQAAASQMAEEDEILGMAEVLGMSIDRKQNLEDTWRQCVTSCRRRYKWQTKAVRFKDVVTMLENPEISNEETHFGVIMCPTSGKIVYRKAYKAIPDSASEDAGRETSDDDDGDDDGRPGRSVRRSTSM